LRLQCAREGAAAQQREVELGRGDVRAATLLVSQLQDLQRLLAEDGDRENGEVAEQLHDARRQLQRLRRAQAKQEPGKAGASR
jgi:hypothetical protein